MANIKPWWRGANLTSVTDVLESTKEVRLTQLWLLLCPPPVVPLPVTVFSFELDGFFLSLVDVWGGPPATSSQMAAVRSKEQVAITWNNVWYYALMHDGHLVLVSWILPNISLIHFTYLTKFRVCPIDLPNGSKMRFPWCSAYPGVVYFISIPYLKIKMS